MSAHTLVNAPRGHAWNERMLGDGFALRNLCARDRAWTVSAKPEFGKEINLSGPGAVSTASLDPQIVRANEISTAAGDRQTRATEIAAAIGHMSGAHGPVRAPAARDEDTGDLAELRALQTELAAVQSARREHEELGRHACEMAAWEKIAPDSSSSEAAAAAVRAATAARRKLTAPPLVLDTAPSSIGGEPRVQYTPAADGAGWWDDRSTVDIGSRLGRRERYREVEQLRGGAGRVRERTMTPRDELSAVPDRCDPRNWSVTELEQHVRGALGTRCPAAKNRSALAHAQIVSLLRRGAHTASAGPHVERTPLGLDEFGAMLREQFSLQGVSDAQVRELFARFSSDANEVDLQDFVRRLFPAESTSVGIGAEGPCMLEDGQMLPTYGRKGPGARCDVIDARTSFVAQPPPAASPVPKHVRLGDFMFADNTRSVTRGPSHETPAPRKHAWTAPSNGFQPASSDIGRYAWNPEMPRPVPGRADGNGSSWMC